MSDDKVVMMPTPVPGLQIEYQVPLGMTGHGIGFRLAVDATIDSKELAERMDVLTSEARRLTYIEELPRSKQLLKMKRASLEEQRKRLANARATMEAHVTLASAGRRKDIDPRPADISNIAQFEKGITDTMQAIGILERRIPYLEGYLRGELTALDDPSEDVLVEAAD
jgi:hypothetical protein